MGQTPEVVWMLPCYLTKAVWVVQLLLILLLLLLLLLQLLIILLLHLQLLLILLLHLKLLLILLLLLQSKVSSPPTGLAAENQIGCSTINLH